MAIGSSPHSAPPATMFDRIWAQHVVAEGPGGQTLLYVDRHLLHEGSTAAFDRLARSGRTVRRPDLAVATADHYVLTSPGAPAPDDEIRRMVESLAAHTARHGIVFFGRGDVRRGIVHVIAPEQGLTLPGMLLVCDVRFDAGGAEKPEFVLNQASYREARILVAAENFGCGSSREAAVWALGAHGIRVVIAPSPGDIFHQNCFKNGLLP